MSKTVEIAELSVKLWVKDGEASPTTDYSRTPRQATPDENESRKTPR